MLHKNIAACRLTIFLAALIAFYLLSCAPAAAAAAAKLQTVRFGRHRTFTRLVFDIQGPRPNHIATLPDHSIVIAYSQLQTRVRSTTLRHRLRRYVTAVTFKNQPGSSSIEFSLRPHAAVHYFFLKYTPARSGWYRLVMDFAYRAASSAKATPAAVRQGRVRSSQPPNRQASAKPRPNTPPKVTAPPAAISVLSHSDKPAEPQPAGDPFAIPNRDFLKYRSALPAHALTIIDEYEAALQKHPQSPQMPLALYRYALAYSALGDSVRAQEIWRRVVVDHPDADSVDLCWFHIGHIDWQRKDYLKAILAFQHARAEKLDTKTRLALYYELGQCLAAVEHHEQAIENFQKCLKEDPEYYLQKPDLLRSMGVSWFALHKYAKCNEYLFQYLNLQDRAPDQDIVLARIADALQQLDQPKLAKKLYAYVEKHFPNSEGYIISKIRQAEALEQQQGGTSPKAYAIYKKLSRLSLSAPLRKLVFFKLASWEFEHQNYSKSLATINDVLGGRNDLNPYASFQALKQQVVKAWAKRSLAGRDYLHVITLYENNKALFQDQGSTFMAAAAAESYRKLQIYPPALTIYKKLLATPGPLNTPYLLKAAQCSFYMNDLKAARQYCAKIPANTMSIQKSLLLAQVQFAAKDYQKAAQLFSRLLSSKDGAAALTMANRMEYAESLIKLNKPQEALASLQQADQQLGANHPQQRVRSYLLQTQCYENLKQPDKAIGSVRQALALTSSKELRDQLNYQLASLYVATRQMKKATANLSALAQSGQGFWKKAAQQQLTYLKVQNVSSP